MSGEILYDACIQVIATRPAVLTLTPPDKAISVQSIQCAPNTAHRYADHIREILLGIYAIHALLVRIIPGLAGGVSNVIVSAKPDTVIQRA